MEAAIAQSVQWLDYGLHNRGSIPRKGHRVQNGSTAHQANYTTGTGTYFPRGKAAEAWISPFISI
jgi:hypothetical protein